MLGPALQPDGALHGLAALRSLDLQEVSFENPPNVDMRHVSKTPAPPLVVRCDASQVRFRKKGIVTKY